MNWDQIAGNWKQFQGKARQQWGKLTDDDFDKVEGKREELVGRVQERYGIAREEAERQVKTGRRGFSARHRTGAIQAFRIPSIRLNLPKTSL